MLAIINLCEEHHEKLGNEVVVTDARFNVPFLVRTCVKEGCGAEATWVVRVILPDKVNETGN
jgi:hypothetical protein